MQALAVIDSLVLPGTETLDVRDKAAVAKRIKGAVSAKQHGLEDVLCPLIAEVSAPALQWSARSPHSGAPALPAVMRTAQQFAAAWSELVRHSTWHGSRMNLQR
jgi:hypothetical protein